MGCRNHAAAVINNGDLVLFWIILLSVGAQTISTPPVLRLDRNWHVAPSEPINSIVTKVRAENTGDRNIRFGLESTGVPAPFRIDNATGVVYVNDSLIDKLGKSYSLWVTGFDGELEAKTEVWALITNSTGNQKLPTVPSNWPRWPSNGHYPSFPPGFNTERTNYPKQTRPPRPLPVPTFPSSTEDITPTKETITTTEEYKELDNNVTQTEIVDVPNELDKYSNGTTKEEEVKSESDLTMTLIPFVATSCLIIIVVIVLVILWKRDVLTRMKSKKKGKSKENAAGSIVLQDHHLNDWERPRAPSNTYEAWNANNPLQGQENQCNEEKHDEWEVPRHRIRIFKIVGEGAFGQVWRATATEIDGQKGPVTVAVKTMKDNASEKEKKDLLLELEVMKKLEPHPNVVRLLGCCSEKEPTLVIMEFVALGKLQSFLRDSRAGRHYGNTHADSKTLTSRDLTHFAYQVARGMDFLSSFGIIHRDLAARNILIDENRLCKVADFGFARDVAGTHVYERKSDGRLPIRWMAPESLYDDIFSVKSDIWSFGVLIWEIVTLGSTPYPGLSAAEVMRKVKEGHRLEKPEHCRRELYNIMYYCWEANPQERPDFKECLALLEKLLMTETDYIELERFPDHSYYNVQHLEGEKL